jgi:hypothetical protein
MMAEEKKRFRGGPTVLQEKTLFFIWRYEMDFGRPPPTSIVGELMYGSTKNASDNVRRHVRRLVSRGLLAVQELPKPGRPRKGASPYRLTDFARKQLEAACPGLRKVS